MWSERRPACSRGSADDDDVAPCGCWPSSATLGPASTGATACALVLACVKEAEVLSAVWTDERSLQVR
jgi:hypothetical protein